MLETAPDELRFTRVVFAAAAPAETTVRRSARDSPASTAGRRFMSALEDRHVRSEVNSLR